MFYFGKFEKRWVSLKRGFPENGPQCILGVIWQAIQNPMDCDWWTLIVVACISEPNWICFQKKKVWIVAAQECTILTSFQVIQVQVIVVIDTEITQ